jgi:Holin of 3TMs, for gene-transfer release
VAGLIDISNALLPVINRVLDLIPDPAAKQKAQLEMQAKLIEIVTTESQNQAEINKIEAGNTNLFVSGWRPMIGWVCAVSFGWFYIGAPLAVWIMSIFGVHTDLPIFDKNSLMELTFGMLGMGALRSFDKWKGTAK